MNPAQPNPPWYAPWRGAAPDSSSSQALDPADLGTAFGLDLSMAPDVLAPPAVASGEPPAAGWVQRMARRTRRD